MKRLVISQGLIKRHTHVAAILRDHFGCPTELQTDNIWCRDFMPVQVSSDTLVKFTYRGYGVGFAGYPWLRVPRKVWNLSSFQGNVTQSKIVLDGGNIMFSPDHSLVLMTDMVFRHNSNMPGARLISRLEKLLNSQVVTVPVEPGDDIGHIDGCCVFTPTTHGGKAVGRMVHASPPHVLLNDYVRKGTAGYCRYADRIQKALSDAGISFTLFPYAYHRCPNITEHMFRRQFPFGDTCNPAFGYYINMLVFDGHVALPSFGIDEDAEALNATRLAFPHHDVFPIDCRALSMEGGLLNCVTADYDFPE